MNTKINDPVFGEMQYKHRWYKEITLTIFAKKWKIILAVKAYSGKSITNEQRTSYSVFLQKKQNYIKSVEKIVIDYINDNCEELSETWEDAHNIEDIEELNRIVIPKTLLIKEDGTTVFLFDCPWDEHGLGVRIIPRRGVGTQDSFL